MGEGYSPLRQVERVESPETEFNKEVDEIIEKITGLFDKFKAARKAYRIAQADGTSLEERARLDTDLNNKTMSMYRLLDKMEKLGLSVDLENRSN
jgi:uncharacterized protein (UPF0335 family)